MKKALIILAVLAGLTAYFWLDNRGLHSWYWSIVSQAQAEGLVPLTGAESRTADLINPVSWFDPAPDQQWFIPHAFVASDHGIGTDIFAVRLVKYSKFEPYKNETVIVYSPDRKSSDFLKVAEAKGRLEERRFDFQPNEPHQFHEELLELIKP
jgi:hypothetical protein